MPRRPGLSRGEVVVSLCIVLVVGALAVTGVVRVREAAARMSCSNNLKQLGLAVHNYASANQDKLPPLADQGTGAPTGQGLPSVYRLLGPFIEASVHVYSVGKSPPANYHAHSSVPFTFHNKGGGTGTMHGGDANQIWKTFLCPSDATANRLRDVPMTLPDGTTGHYATGSYAVNGLLPWGTGRLPQPGGSAETILFAERPQVCRTAAGETVYNLWGLGFYSPHMPAFAALTPADPPGLGSTGQIAPVLPLPDEGAADRGARIRVRVGLRDAEPTVPDFATPIQLIGRGPCDPRLPGTSHRAGMQATMADGSVRTFAPDTEPWVFWTACAARRPAMEPMDRK